MLERTLEYLGVEKESTIGPYHIPIKLIFWSTPKTKKQAIFCQKYTEFSYWGFYKILKLMAMYGDPVYLDIGFINSP
ncbi:hypothetical protein BAQ49_03895 [Bacillus proteolyticus]|uniref:Uncharacterized protein n=1 Tax=Bacillus proteolyticus TaxID=2026192 RepID=A0AA44R4Q2_9BACI|nr:hypothetical protein BAQ49_03895 [Bacillus proteolyticus]